jgi:hypothetical protein
MPRITLVLLNGCVEAFSFTLDLLSAPMSGSIGIAGGGCPSGGASVRINPRGRSDGGVGAEVPNTGINEWYWVLDDASAASPNSGGGAVNPTSVNLEITCR